MLGIQNIHHPQQAVHHVLLVALVVILAQLQREQHVLGDGERVEQRAGLEHHSHFLANAPQFRLGEIRDIFMRHDHPPAVRFQKTHDVRQRYRLAHAAAADDRHRLPGVHVKVGID